MKLIASQENPELFNKIEKLVYEKDSDLSLFIQLETKEFQNNRIKKHNIERNNIIEKINNPGNQMLKHFNRTESTAKIITDQNDFNLDTKMPNFKGNKTPYLNTDSKKFSKSINKCDLGDTVMPKYLQDDMRFQLPSAIKSRESYNIPSDRKSEHYMCN